MKTLRLFVLCLMAVSSYAQQAITGFEAPESVIKSSDKIFVSNIGGAQPNPMAMDGNGFITELSAAGNVVQQKFNKTVLNGPKGLAATGNTLYTADINRVVGFNINSGEQVFELNFPEVKMLNDLCIVDDKHLAVSESIINKVYLINLDDKSYHFLGTIPGANGVTYNAKTKQLFACGMGEQMNGTGKLYVKDLGNKDTIFTELSNSPVGVFDGLEMTDDDHLLLTDWHGADSTKGKFVVYSLKDHNSKNYSIDAGPADVYFDKSSHSFYLPQMLKNTLLIEDLNKLKPE